MAAGGSVPAFERHYCLRELAELWGLSVDTVRRLFETEPGVLRISVGYRRGREHRTTFRIPESVAARVHAEHC